MTTAGKLDDPIEEHRLRCEPHLLRLRMLARGGAEATLPRQVMAEVVRSVTAILAEAEAASSDARTAEDGQPSPGAGTFVRVRLNRLAAAADEAITAAAAGNHTQLDRHLSRFDSLTAAIWTVQQAVYGPGPVLGPSGERN